jgi:hypothetical protein
MSALDVELNYVSPGISDEFGLTAQIDTLRDRIDQGNQALELERQHALDIHKARAQAVEQSSALRLVFESDREEPGDSLTLEQILSSAFQQTIQRASLPEGVAKSLAKQLRTELHPDRGGDVETAKLVGASLEDMDTDEVLAISKAVLAAKPQKAQTLQDLRDERYKLIIVADSINPVFASPEDAAAHKEREITGAEWIVRSEAASRTVRMILGSPEQWRNFLKGIIEQRNFVLINMVNSLIPEISRIQERIQKGDPLILSEAQIAEVDKILERVWTTLDPKGRRGPYVPPYQNWLEIVVPMLRILDPGEKPGQTYTLFPEPIQIVQQPKVIEKFPKKELFKEDYGSKKISRNYIEETISYSNYKDY